MARAGSAMLDKAMTPLLGLTLAVVMAGLAVAWVVVSERTLRAERAIKLPCELDPTRSDSAVSRRRCPAARVGSP